jgi:pSer/pThr/pTyr-binding forkhead associated (FHA) protein
MAKLVLNFNGKTIQEYKLDKEILTIGRKPYNDIRIDTPATSGKHAKVLTILEDSFIEDLDSTNGTFIGGNKISNHALQNGDSIIIGNHELKYVNANAECGESQLNKTMITRPPKKDIAKTKAAAKSIKKSNDKIEAGIASSDTTINGHSHAKLQLISGTNAGKELQLSKILTTLGKPGVQTAAITHRPTGYFLIVVDAGKDKQMPLVNDQEIHKEKSLADGDVIEVAGVQMRFNLI